MNPINSLLSLFRVDKTSKNSKKVPYFKNEYIAGKKNIHRRFVSDITEPNKEIHDSYRRIRNAARFKEQNSEIAQAILSTKTTQVVGRGININPQVKDKRGKVASDINQYISEVWNDWDKVASVSGDLSFRAIQRLAYRRRCVDGDVFLQIIKGKSSYKYKTDIELAVELIVSESVDFDKNEPDNNIFNGIELDEWKRPINYFIFKKGNQTKKVSAEQVIHYKNVPFPTQQRGVSIFASCLDRFTDLDDSIDAELIASKLASSLMGIYKTENPSEESAMPDYFSPGTIAQINRDDDIIVPDTKRPNSQFSEFYELVLKSICSGTGANYASVSRDYEGSYSSKRQELNEQFAFSLVERAEIISQFIRPIYEHFIDAIESRIKEKFNHRYDDKTLKRCEFNGEALIQIDPTKEAKAIQTYISTGVKTRKRAMRDIGVENPQLELSEIISEKKQMELVNE